MNAPTQAAHLAEPNVKLLPLTQIILSSTRSQEQRRKTYDAAAMAELAASIKESGVLFPVLVRPLEGRKGGKEYEVIAGERRFIAGQQAGLDSIPARILALTDAQVQKAQLVENIQREALDTLAEALGYDDLIKGGIAAEVIGDMIGKSRSYVYARVQLLKLAPGVQEALSDNEINASQALLFARLPLKLQEVALKTLERYGYHVDDGAGSYRDTAELFRDRGKGLFIPLKNVSWRLDDASLFVFGPKLGKNQAQDVVALPDCLSCPKRSGNDAELLEVLEGETHLCLDKGCFDAKAKQSLERRRKAAEESGQPILTGEEAATIMPTDYGTRGYIDLDEECRADVYQVPEPKADFDSPEYQEWEKNSEAHQPRSYRELLGDDLAELEIKFAQDPKQKSRIVDLAPDKEVMKLLKAKGFKVQVRRDESKPEPTPKVQDPEAARRAGEKRAREEAEAQLKEQIESEYQKRLLRAVHEKYKGPFKRDDLELIAQPLVNDYDTGEVLGVLFKKPPSLATMNERDLMRLIITMLVGREYTNDGSDRAVLALAKRLKLDPKALRKDVVKELTPPSEGAAAKPTKKSSKKK